MAAKELVVGNNSSAPKADLEFSNSRSLRRSWQKSLGSGSRT